MAASGRLSHSPAMEGEGAQAAALASAAGCGASGEPDDSPMCGSGHRLVSVFHG